MNHPSGVTGDTAQPVSVQPVPPLLHAVQTALQAVAAHDKPLAVQRIDAIEATLGPGWNPARTHLRAAQATVDISRWDLVVDHLNSIAHTLNPHSSAEG